MPSAAILQRFLRRVDAHAIVARVSLPLATLDRRGCAAKASVPTATMHDRLPEREAALSSPHCVWVHSSVSNQLPPAIFFPACRRHDVDELVGATDPPANDNCLPPGVTPIPMSTLGAASPLFSIPDHSCSYFAVRIPLVRAGFRRVGAQSGPPPARQQPTTSDCDTASTGDEAPQTDAALALPGSAKTLTLSPKVNVMWRRSWPPARLPPGVTKARLDLLRASNSTLSWKTLPPLADIPLRQATVKVNHFSSSHKNLGCKSGMWLNIRKAMQSWNAGGDVRHDDLTPRTWRLPEDLDAFEAMLADRCARATGNIEGNGEMTKREGNGRLISKPSKGSCGRGIEIFDVKSPELAALVRRYREFDYVSHRAAATAQRDVTLPSFPSRPDDAAGVRRPPPPPVPRVVQQYIENPLLIDGRKFDFRFYVAVTSFDPLVVYLHEDGLVRFAAASYQDVATVVTSSPGATSSITSGDRVAHLTNYSVGRHLERRARLDYMVSHGMLPGRGDPAELGPEDNVTGPDSAPLATPPPPPVVIPRDVAKAVTLDLKWSMARLFDRLRRHVGGDEIVIEKVKRDIEDVIVKTLIAAHSSIFAQSCVVEGSHDMCFELFGFDIMLDDQLRPWLIEVNTLPSLESSSDFDYNVKTTVARDLFNLARIPLIERSPNDFAARSSLPSSSDSPSCYPPLPAAAGSETAVVALPQPCALALLTSRIVLPVDAIPSPSSPPPCSSNNVRHHDTDAAAAASAAGAVTIDAELAVARMIDEGRVAGRFRRIFPTADRVTSREFDKLFDSGVTTQRLIGSWNAMRERGQSLA